MQLLKQKLKTKKYQYLYLKEKLNKKLELTLKNAQEAEDDGICAFESYDPEFNRLDHLVEWLKRINKKYNYA